MGVGVLMSLWAFGVRGCACKQKRERERHMGEPGERRERVCVVGCGYVDDNTLSHPARSAEGRSTTHMCSARCSKNALT